MISNKKILKNGRSGFSLELTNNGLIKKEKNSNWSLVKDIFTVLKNTKFSYFFNLIKEDSKYYYYEFLEGYFYQDVQIMDDLQIQKILDCILELQQRKINGLYIVHGDLSPVNACFDQKTHLPIKVIDWDGAYLGSKYDDVSYVCWLWVNFGNPNYEPNFYLQKLQKIFQYLNYDSNDIAEIKKAIIKRINRDKNKYLKNEFLKDWYDYCSKWISENWEEFNENLADKLNKD